MATEVRTAHARYFAGREADILALWDSPRQREAYDWLATELANLRTAFRWSTDQGDLDTAAAVVSYAVFLGVMVENEEPIAWAEALIEPARSVNHRRLLSLYTMAAQCYTSGRIEESVRYSEAAERMLGTGPDEVPYGSAPWALGGYLAIGQHNLYLRSQTASVSGLPCTSTTVMVHILA